MNGLDQSKVAKHNPNGGRLQTPMQMSAYNHFSHLLAKLRYYQTNYHHIIGKHQTAKNLIMEFF